MSGCVCCAAHAAAIAWRRRALSFSTVGSFSIVSRSPLLVAVSVRVSDAIDRPGFGRYRSMGAVRRRVHPGLRDRRRVVDGLASRRLAWSNRRGAVSHRSALPVSLVGCGRLRSQFVVGRALPPGWSSWFRGQFVVSGVGALPPWLVIVDSWSVGSLVLSSVCVSWLVGRGRAVDAWSVVGSDSSLIRGRSRGFTSSAV